jgi:hypothetical protein
MRMKDKVTTMAILIAALLATASALGHSDESTKEQWNFSSEQEYVNEPVRQPVTLSAEALEALAADQNVNACLKETGKSADQAFSWFVASEIHLGGGDEIDYVVLPSLLSKAEQPGDMPDNACFRRANAAWFWALRNTRQGYKLVFSGAGHDLSVLRHRTNGFRDIKTSTAIQAGGMISETVYRFDGRRYVMVKVGERPGE